MSNKFGISVLALTSVLITGCKQTFNTHAQLAKEVVESNPRVTPTPAATATPTPTATPGTPTPTPSPSATPAPLASANIFFSGHSLLSWPVAYLTTSSAQSLGLGSLYNEQMRGGSSIKARSRGSGAEGSTSFPGYSDAAALNRDYQAIDVLDELTFGRTIGSARYNTLVITERHDMVNALTDQDTVKYLRHYHDQFIRANASGQTYFYSPWLSHKDDKAREWIAYERAIYLGWDCVSVRINHSLSTVGRADRIKMIPASLALADLVERALDGNVTGISGGTTVQVLQRLFSDDVHLTELGSYYVAMVTLAAVYKRSPAGAAHPSGVTGQQAASLQTAAWNFVSNHMQSAPVRTLSQCQSSVPELCATFWNFDWIYANRPDLVPSCEARLRTQNTSNPFFYSSATDVAYWLPNPQ